MKDWKTDGMTDRWTVRQMDWRNDGQKIQANKFYEKRTIKNPVNVFSKICQTIFYKTSVAIGEGSDWIYDISTTGWGEIPNKTVIFKYFSKLVQIVYFLRQFEGKFHYGPKTVSQLVSLWQAWLNRSFLKLTITLLHKLKLRIFQDNLKKKLL